MEKENVLPYMLFNNYLYGRMPWKGWQEGREVTAWMTGDSPYWFHQFF